MAEYTKEQQFDLINKEPDNLQYIDNQYEEVCLMAVGKRGRCLEYVRNQTPEICMTAVNENGWSLQYVEEQTPEICLEAVKNNGYSLKYVKEQTQEICMTAVKKSGKSLQYVEEQTPEICLEAVKEEGSALQYVKKQTPEICLAAVKSFGSGVLSLVKEQTPEICIAAVKRDIYDMEFVKIKMNKELEDVCAKGVNRYYKSIKKCKNKTSKICFYAFLADYSLLDYKYIENGINKFMKSNKNFNNKVFFCNDGRYCDSVNKNWGEYELLKADYKSLEKIKDFFINSISNSYILIDNEERVDIEFLKSIALSNNAIVLIKREYEEVDPMYKTFANHIITMTELNNFLTK